MTLSKQNRFVYCEDCGCRLEMNGICKICGHEDNPLLTFMVPDVIDITQEAAEGLITHPEAQLTVGNVTETTDPAIVAGNVISSDPVKDTQLTKDATVDIVVSTGPV